MEKQETEEVEKVDDLLNTFNSQLKFEQKADQNKTSKRFKPYKSKKRKSKKSASKEEAKASQEKPPSPVFKNCSIESRSTEFSPEDLHPCYEEEVNVNELCAYLENAELIPRKMSSMAEAIYG
ncbi:Oidioi.mRNA.OKI2018_I69.chr2.g7522.t1.cds [Oikopleura dioica]|uniref:Oidioi.mRNA.OKI2018_I69.chr2.g7522.t1.cds n=1 Tax=Oikopleura dioica TaxID=34765 RepID=A0ABN7TFD3_OIKDI|nr:Oidioi.mRNA.OKI2018_I69.chr2.g7522.t1.cds [Oikopleura dioica]